MAIVTGGGSGLGRETALELARCGAASSSAAVASSRWKRPWPPIRADLIEAHRVRYSRGGAGRRAWWTASSPRHGQIDLLVNNAGGQFLAPAESITPKGFRTVIRLNVEGTWLVTHAVATKAMIPSGRGRQGVQRDALPAQRHARHGPFGRRSRRG